MPPLRHPITSAALKLPSRQVAIYAPGAGDLYAASPRTIGGAEMQMTMLATALAERGFDVAHIVFASSAPSPAPEAKISLVQRGCHRGDNLVAEARAVWRGLSRADAATYIFRMSSAALGVAAAFCRLHRRRLIFSSASDADFTFERQWRNPLVTKCYRFGVGLAHTTVVQTARQSQLAHEAFPYISRMVEIPSMVSSGGHARAPMAVLWIGRLVDYKRPAMFLDLAESVPEGQFRMIGVETFQTPPALLREVTARASALPNLEFFGPQDRKTTLRMIEEAVAMVSTSHVEGMPNVFLEGWVRGIPALSFDFDPDDRISRFGLGVAAGGDWDGFVRGAQQLWARRDSRQDLAAHLAQYARSRHDPAVVVDRWIEVLSSSR